ncbi:MAG TPA: ribose-5-phosphate isomerase RpiA [Acidimicrobiales bacterium]|nr:ribose-5-phosphate isomerase RpiA [Acidimicrobiales bacterium]
MTEDLEREKQLAAQSAAELVEDGMRIGLGTGSTVAYLLPILAHQRMRITCVATSPRTEQAARAFGLAIAPFDTLDRLDLTIDGADQITTQGWLIKGGGGAHTREKIVAASSERFVIIADSSKLVDALSPPVPMELLAFGISTTLQRLEPSTIRDTVDGQRSPDGGIIADFLGDIEDPRTLDDRLSCTPGVIDHGIFAPELVTGFFIGSGDMVSITTRSVRP